MKTRRMTHQFVESLPEPLSAGVLYVTNDRDLAAHLCACGCGKEVITPLSPTGWRLKLTPRGASLEPSIGNWSFPCRSHYVVRAGEVQVASDMPQWAIEQGRARDQSQRVKYYEERATGVAASSPIERHLGKPSSGWRRVLAFLGLWK